ncbi:MAG: isopentenyldiphosphate isomerase [Acidimicrobiales bacterium]
MIKKSNQLLNSMSAERIYNKIQIVDNKDNLLGVETYHDAIRKCCIRRASRVMIINEAGKVLVSRRSEHISKPLLLDNSAAGHVDEGEGYYEAALRELEEELGISGYELEEIAISYRSVDFFISLYRLVVPNDVKINIDPHEVKEIYWMDVTEIDSLIVDKQEECTTSLVEVWTQFRDKLIQ